MGFGIAAAIGLGTAAAGLLGGETKGKETTGRAPAPWEADMRQFWDEYVDTFFGTGQEVGSKVWTEEYIKLRPDIKAWYDMKSRKESLEDFAATHYKKWGIDEGMDVLMEQAMPDPEASLRELLSEQLATQREATETFETQLRDITGEYQTGIGKETEELQKYISETYMPETQVAEERYLTKPFQYQIAGQPQEAILKPARTAYETLAGAAGKQLGAQQLGYGAEIIGLDKILGAGTQALESILPLQLAYTPQKADIDYINILQNLGMQMQQFRYGLPQTTQRGEYQPSLLQTFRTAASAAAPFIGV